MDDLLNRCKEAVVKGDRNLSTDLATGGMEKGYDILEMVEKGFSAGIRRAGDLWEAGEYFLPELAFSAEAMKAAMDVLQPALLKSNQAGDTKGKVIIGTIQGDIHDIGKTLVATMLAANGYLVIDLGADVSYDRFVQQASEQEAKFVCMSALLTTTMPGQGEVINRLEQEGLRKSLRVIVGGAPTNESWADEIGADGFADNAVSAVHVADSLTRGL